MENLKILILKVASILDWNHGWQHHFKY